MELVTFLRLRWLLLGVASCLVGCSASTTTTYGVDGASDMGVASDSSVGTDASTPSDASTVFTDASYFGTSSLQLQSYDPGYPIELAPGQALRLTIRALDGLAAPAGNVLITFALLGSTEGATLLDIFGYTDVNGLVSFYVQAGYQATTFQVRVSSQDGAIYVPIVVRDATLVDLPISLDPGVLGLVSDATVQAFAGVTCDAVLGVPPSASDSFDSNGAAKLQSVASSIDYAIVATAMLSGGTQVQQCVSGVVPGSAVVPAFDFGLLDPPVVVP